MSAKKAKSVLHLRAGDAMKNYLCAGLLTLGILCAVGVNAGQAPESSPPLGLPPVPIPEDNLQTQEKIDLGEVLFHDNRFSTTGEVSCATCHAAEKAFTDSPLSVSEGIDKLTGTRNAPSVVNAVFRRSGRLQNPDAAQRGSYCALYARRQPEHAA